MNFQRATIEITNINSYFQSNIEDGEWHLKLIGEFTKTSQSNIGGGPKIVFKGREVDLREKLVSISIKPLSAETTFPRKSSSMPWVSNDECRDAVRIDGLEDGGYVHCQIAIYMNESDINHLRNVNLQSHQLVVNIGYMDGIDDPRPLKESVADHLFAYLNDATIHILSYKDGSRQMEYIPLLKDEKEIPQGSNVLENISSTIKTMSEEIIELKTLLKYSIISIIILLAIMVIK